MTTTQTQTEPNPKTETKVSAAVLSVVRDYVKTKIQTDDVKRKADEKVESKYWPMVMQAVKMFEADTERADIQAEFREAFKQTHVGDIASRHEATFRLMSANVTKIAYKGREWVEEQKNAGLGFWATLKLINEPESTVPPEEPKKNGNGKAKPSKANGKAKASTHKRSGNVGVREGEAASESTAYDLDAIMETIEETPKLFVEIVNHVIEASMVPFDTFETVYKAIGKHLKKA